MYISAKIASLKRQAQTWSPNWMVQATQMRYLQRMYRQGHRKITAEIKNELESIRAIGKKD